MSYSILVIDDEQSIRDSVKGVLTDEGYQVLTAGSGTEGIETIRSKKPDVVILDIWMPQMDGIETLKHIKVEWPQQPVIMMSGHGTIETAVKATKLGAYDFVEKPIYLERLLVLIKNVIATQDLVRENHALRQQVQKNKQFVGQSSVIQQIKEMIQQVGPTTGSVLITGENGTGKELVAHNIHAASTRFDKPFVEVNCAAIPEELIESELFGHEKGAFTGATQMRRGKFDLANGGTLFLDEIGDMSLKTQAKILRILQEQKFERVGGTQTTTVDVRIIAATNKDLKNEISRGGFREDLFYRLNVIPFQVPPLRKRKEDIRALAEHFLKEFAQTHGKPARDLHPEALKVLENYTWPGNVRELRNLIERMTILTPESAGVRPVSAAELLQHLQGEYGSLTVAPTEATDHREARNLREARQEFEKQYILKILEENAWNVSKTAAILGVERSHLHKKIKSYGLEAPE